MLWKGKCELGRKRVGLRIHGSCCMTPALAQKDDERGKGTGRSIGRKVFLG